MFKERLFTMVAAGALVGAALTTGLLPQSGLAQQREIIITQQPGAETQGTGQIEPGLEESGEVGELKEQERLADSAVFLREQEEAETVASLLLGQALYNQQAEKLGTIDDLIIGEDGTLKAVIVGVGGFLGIGKKNVAVRYDEITTSRQAETEEILLVINATADDLQAAPEFETLAMKLAREEAERAAAEAERLQQQGTGAPQPLEQPAPSTN